MQERGSFEIDMELRGIIDLEGTSCAMMGRFIDFVVVLRVFVVVPTCVLLISKLVLMYSLHK